MVTLVNFNSADSKSGRVSVISQHTAQRDTVTHSDYYNIKPNSLEDG